MRPGATVRASLLGLLLGTLGSLSVACRRPDPPKPYTAYVVNHQSATLAAVNLASFRVTASLPVAAEPQQVLARPGTRQLYVVSGNGKISVAAFPPLRLVATLDPGKSARDLAFSPDGRSAYVLDPANHEVVFLDCHTDPGNPAETQIPKVASRLRLEAALSHLALSPDGKTLVAAAPVANQLIFISTESRQVLGTVEVGQTPGQLAILPDSSKVFVADEGEEKISAADVASRRLYSHIEIGSRPTALLVKPDGGELYVLAAQSATLVIVDAFHDNVEGTFPLGRNPVAGIFRKDFSVLYIANAGDGSVLSLDVTNREALASTHIGMEPRALALTPDERFLVVADSAASSLEVLHADPASLSNSRSLLITTVTVGGSPVDVVVPDYLEKE